MLTATAVKIPAREEGALIAGGARSELGELAWRGLLRTHACLVKRLDAELERAHGLPMSSYEVLHYLSHATTGRMRTSAARTTAVSRAAPPARKWW